MSALPRVLLVDDNVGVLETLADIISTCGFVVDTAADGAEAETRLKEHRYDVAVYDIVLPDVNGVELVRRTRPGSPDTKFVIITAYTNSEFIDEARAERIDDILLKPLDPGRLIAALRRLTARPSA